MQRESLLVEIRTELSIAHAGRNRHCARLGVKRDYLVHRLQREEGMLAVGDVVEAVPRAEDFEFFTLLPDEVCALARAR